MGSANLPQTAMGSANLPQTAVTICTPYLLPFVDLKEYIDISVLYTPLNYLPYHVYMYKEYCHRNILT